MRSISLQLVEYGLNIGGLEGGGLIISLLIKRAIFLASVTIFDCVGLDYFGMILFIYFFFFTFYFFYFFYFLLLLLWT